MSDPSWGQGNIWQSPGNFAFPNPQTFVNTPGASQSQITAPAPAASGWNYYELVCESAGSGGVCIGVVTDTNPGVNIHENTGTPNCTWIYENTAVFNNGNSVGYDLPSPNVTGRHYGCLLNQGTGQVAFSPDGSTWNNGHTAADIISGVGVITFDYTTPGTVWPFVSMNSIDCSFAIFASAENCAYALPSGASYLPANLAFAITSVSSVPGDAVGIAWAVSAGTLSGSMNYSLDGGSYTACTGETSGTEGTALGPTLTSGLHTILLEDPAAPDSPTPSQVFYTTTQPSGTGSLVFTSSGNSLSSVGISTTFESFDLPGGFIYELYMEAVSTSGTLQLTGGNDLTISAVGTQTPGYETMGGFDDPDAPDPVASYQNGYVGFTATTGPSEVEIYESTSMVGTVLVADGSDGKGTMTASINNNGAASTFNNVFETFSAFTTLTLDSGTIFPGYDTTYGYYVAVYAVALPEALTLESGVYLPDEVLTVTGAVSNATLTALGLSLDAGAFEDSTSQTPTSATGAFSATLDGVISPGTHTLQGKDLSTGVLSNTIIIDADTLYVSQAVEQVLLSIPDQLLASQAVEQVLLSLPQFNRVGLFQTDVVPNAESTCVEFGENLSWNYETSLLPDNQEVSSNGMIVTTLGMAFVGSSPVVAVQATDADGNVITQAAIVSGGTDSLWDEATWDVDVWDGTPSPISPWQIPWPVAVVFRQMQVGASGYSVAGFRVGNLYMQYQQLGYVAQLPSGAR